MYRHAKSLTDIPALLSRAKTNVAAHRYCEFRRGIEQVKTSLGARQTLSHIPEEVWLGRFEADAAAPCAVIDQLVACDE